MKEYHQTIATNNSEITLWEIIKLLLSKFYWLLLSGVIFGIGVYFIIEVFVTPTFESCVSFYVYNSSDSKAYSGTVNTSDLQAAESLATTYSKILGSNSVLDAVLENLGEEDNISRKDLSEMVEVAVVDDTQLLEVVVTSTDAEFSCEVANSFAKVAPKEIVRITKAGGVEVVDRPEVAKEKASPRTVFDAAIGFIIGVIIASVIVILKAISDTTIYLPEDIENLVDTTILGQIPRIDVSDEKYTSWKVVKGGEVFYEKKKRKEQDIE